MPRPRRRSVVVLAVGALLVGVYFLLRAGDVVGQPTDIGGGLILLFGYVVTFLGVVLVLSDLRRQRK